MIETSPAIRLRAHHLLCVLTFAGHGYSDAFTENLRRIVERLHSGESIEIIDGPDDICAALQAEFGAAAHCENASVTERDRQAKSDLLGVPELAPLLVAKLAMALAPSHIVDLRARFADGSIRSACAGCEWFGFCTELASNNYRAAVL